MPTVSIDPCYFWPRSPLPLKTKHCDLCPVGHTSKMSQRKCKPLMSPRNTYPCLYNEQKYGGSQVSNVENGAERKFRLIWPWNSGHRSKVRVYVRPWNFQGRCKIVQRLGIPSLAMIGHSVRELFPENPRGTGVGMSQSGGASSTLSLSSEPITVLKITDIKISDIQINFGPVFRSYHSSEDIWR